jgi:hypothetical protein
MKATTKVDYTVLSNKKCRICGRLLKQNLISRNPDADKCFGHHMKLVRKNPKYFKLR